MQFWQSAWKLSISLPPFLLTVTKWSCWRKGSPPPSHLLYFSSSRIVEFTSITPFIHTLPDVPYPDCRICWFTCKDCAKLNRKPLSGSSLCNQELILLNQILLFPTLCAHSSFEKSIIFLFYHKNKFNSRTALLWVELVLSKYLDSFSSLWVIIYSLPMLPCLVSSLLI